MLKYKTHDFRIFATGLEKDIIMTKIKEPTKQIKRDRRDMIQYINLQLASLGQPLFSDDSDAGSKYTNAKFQSLTEGLINSFREKSRLLSGHFSPVVL